jgi:hypothetical protein
MNGKYEGLTSAQKSCVIVQTGNCFGTARRAVNLPKQVGERPDRVVELVRSIQRDGTAVFQRTLHSDVDCALAGPGRGTGGKYFLLSPASLSALSYEYNSSRPVIRLWNDDHHVGA